MCPLTPPPPRSSYDPPRVCATPAHAWAAAHAAQPPEACCHVSSRTVSFAILAIFPFTSASKRMGIVVRNLSTGLITFYEKGADAVMQDIVKPSNWLEEECCNLAQEGLRTLVFGYVSGSGALTCAP